MKSKHYLSALVLACGSLLGATLLAQDRPQRQSSPTFGERFEEFWHGVVGSDEQPNGSYSRQRSGQPTRARPSTNRGQMPSQGRGTTSYRQEEERYEEQAEYDMTEEQVDPPMPKPGPAASQPKPRPRPTTASRPTRTASPTVSAASETEDESAEEPTAARPVTTSRQSSRRTAQPGFRPTPEDTRQATRDSHSDETESAVEDEPIQTEEADAVAESDDSQTAASPEESTAETTVIPPVSTPHQPTRSTTPTAAVEVEEFVVTRASPALRVVTSGPKRLLVGKAGVYKVVLENASETAAHGVAVVVTAPDWAEVVAVQASAGETGTSGEASQAHQWTLRSLPGRSREELTLRIVPRKSQPFDLGVEWTCAPLTAQAQVDVQEAKLELALAGPDEVSYGDKTVYRLTFSNPGTADADDVMVRLLPLGPDEREIANHAIGRIVAGATKVIEVELVARQTGKLTIKVEAHANDGLAAHVEKEILVRRASLEVAVEVPKFQYAASVATYKLTVKNGGNDTARGVEISASLPTGARFVSASEGGVLDADAGRVVWNLQGIEPQSNMVLSLKCALETAGRNQLQVAAKAAGDLSHSASVTTVVDALADLVLDVTDPQGPVPVGEDVHYVVTVRNRGTKGADGVEVVVFFSQGIEPVSVQGGEHQLAQGKVVFRTLTTLAAGDERVLKIKARAQKGGNHVVRAEVHCKSLDSSLAEEETTRFFDDGQVTEEAEQPRPLLEAFDESQPATLEPTPAADDESVFQPGE